MVSGAQPNLYLLVNGNNLTFLRIYTNERIFDNLQFHNSVIRNSFSYSFKESLVYTHSFLNLVFKKKNLKRSNVIIPTKLKIKTLKIGKKN